MSSFQSANVYQHYFYPTTASPVSTSSGIFGSLRAKLGSKDSLSSKSSRLSRSSSISSQSPSSPLSSTSPASTRSFFSNRLSKAPQAPVQSQTRYPNEAPPAYTPIELPADNTHLHYHHQRPISGSDAASMRSSVSVDDKYAFLKSFDTLFLIDDSGSMAGRSWRETQEALTAIAPICTQQDTDGVDVYFLNRADSDLFKSVKDARRVQQIFSKVRPGGGTPTGQKLRAILQDYFKEYIIYEKTGKVSCHVKPINIIVITDGVPTDDVESVIVWAAKKLDKIDAPAWQIGIQFFQVGNEAGARDHLKRLDDDIVSYNNGKEVRDMVDTVPWENDSGSSLNADGILKVVLGAVTRRLDRNSDRLHG